MTNHAVFLDRDGTLNDDPGYLDNPDKVILIPGTGEALSELKNKFKFKLIVISNQSGIDRGLITKESVEAVNRKVNELLKDFNVSIDAFYFCPAHPDFSTPDECKCRKPSPELVFKSAKDYNVDLNKSYFVGDSESDILCGINSGVKTVLVQTGYGKESFSVLQNQNKFPTFIAQNIFEAGKIIIKDFMEHISAI
jgi:D-glycero-D-manno-heptose 1,7-bisphosphate phosphatase